MSTRRHIVGLIICAVLVAAFQYVGLVWSFADFHPGGDGEVPAEISRRAEIGSAMSRPFMAPMFWLVSATGFHPGFILVVYWLVIPICYGAILYLIYVLLRHGFRFKSNRNV